MTDLHEISEESEEHGFKKIITRQKHNVDVDILVICYCGAEWSHPLSITTDEMVSIMNSHEKYFKNKTLIL